MLGSIGVCPLHALLVGDLWMSEGLEEEFYTPEQIAEKLKVQPVTVRRMIRRGQLSGLRVGGRWRVTKTAFDAFLATQTKLTPPADVQQSSDPPGTAQEESCP